MRITALIFALLLGMGGIALADQKPGGNPESPSDDNSGAGNDPPGGAGGAPPGQTTNPNPAKLFDDSLPVWLEGFEVAHHTSDQHGSDAPSGGGGPGQKGQPGPEGNAGP